MKFYRTDSKAALINALVEAGIVTVDDRGNELPQFFEHPDFTVDWIGKIPVPGQSFEEGAEVLFLEGEHFNVYPKVDAPDLSIFAVFTEVTPDLPYRVVGSEERARGVEGLPEGLPTEGGEL